MHPADRSVALLRLVAILLLVSAATTRAHAYDLEGPAWPSGNILMRLQLDATKPISPALPLSDGSQSWNAVATAALNDWNAVLTRSRFTTEISTATPPTKYSDNPSAPVNNVFFAATNYGTAFGSRVLAITLYSPRGVRQLETDVIVNTAYTWDSYRSSLRTAPDLRRVLVHEFGHALGLTHPDQATPAQSVSAIMNSSVSNVDALQADDISGAQALYGTTFAKPIVTTQPSSKTINVGESTTLTVGIDGQNPPVTAPLRAYKWFYASTGSSTFEELFTIKDPLLKFPLAQLTDAGRYYLEATTPDDTVVSNTVTLTVNPVTLTPVTQLANLSTRGIAGSGDSSMIVGFVITGSVNKRVLLRAIGPTLEDFRVTGVLTDPILTIRNSSNLIVATNDNWGAQTGPTTVADLTATTARVGGFALTPGSKDAVVLVDLAPGNYTAVVSTPTGGASGVALVEAYDADSPLNPAVKLANVATRGFVGTGGNILIAGFNVSGPGPRTFLIRISGDTLKDFGVSGTLDDPYLKLFRGSELLRETDDWDSPASLQPALRVAFASVGAFSFTDRQECAMLVTLTPGSYTAQASGFKDGTGVALVEVYEMP